jgi:hypothetical protein
MSGLEGCGGWRIALHGIMEHPKLRRR